MLSKPKLDLGVLVPFVGQRLGVAVSGGSDSVALLHLLHDWGQAELHVVSVNHGLRKAADAEVAFVSKLAMDLGVSFTGLNVNVDSIGNTQSNARMARYQAMGDWAHLNDICAIALGHTAGDQAETFLMNAFRGSGVAGLSAMKSECGNLPTYLRPILGVSRQDLREFLSSRQLSWVDDLSNLDTKYARVAVRAALNGLHESGVDTSGVIRTREQMARADQALEYFAKSEFESMFENILGVEWIADRRRFNSLPDETKGRILAQSVKYFGGHHFRPRYDPIWQALNKLHNENGGATISGCAFKWSANRLRICAETAALPSDGNQKWNGFEIPEGVGELGALGVSAPKYDFWRQLCMSARAAASLPSIRKEGDIVTILGDGSELSKLIVNKWSVW